MHDTYTILHLTPWTRVGLACLSAVLALLVFLLARAIHLKLRRTVPGRARWPLHIVIALTLFWLFDWLSPQIYYVFYWLTLDDLPWQIVVGDSPAFADLLRLFLIDFSADLPPISRGFLGWGLLAQAAWHCLGAPKKTRSQTSGR
jgi:hypothetical protein